MGSAMMLLALMQAGAAAQPAPASALPLTMLAKEDGQHCLDEQRLCLALRASGDGDPRAAALVLSDGAEGSELPIELPPFEQTADNLSLWPQLIPVSDTAPGGGTSWLVGIIERQSLMYSGGGGSVSRLHLFRVALAPHAYRLSAELLSLPWASSRMIRACFSERDGERRRGACHDEYDFGASLTIEAGPAGAGEWPALVYRTQATAFPQTARRGEDSSAAPPLRPSDLSHWRDPDCSFTRRFAYNELTGRYEADRGGPAGCESYWEP